ncbi:MAG: MarR family transcriptional regulator, partial [Parvularcula sp.]|nr:MarR family transcriptional regulator [Parvularcula sp.]
MTQKIPTEKLPESFHSKDSLRLWLRLLSCSMRIEKAIRMRLRSNFDATLPRFDVMAALERADEGLTMSELSAHLLVSNGNVTGLVQRLVQDGLVERRISPGDRRIQRVALTPEGRKTFAVMADGHEQWIDNMFSGLTEED